MILCDTRCPQTINLLTPGVCRRLYQKPNFILQDSSVFFILLRVENATTYNVSECIWRKLIPSFHWWQLCENPNVTFLLINFQSHGTVFPRFHPRLGFTPLHYSDNVMCHLLLQCVWRYLYLFYVLLGFRYTHHLLIKEIGMKGAFPFDFAASYIMLYTFQTMGI